MTFSKLIHINQNQNIINNTYLKEFLPKTNFEYMENVLKWKEVSLRLNSFN